jgi:YidC/Oxa1 family membrane protein insertase
LGKKLSLALLAVPAPAFANERDGWLGWPTDVTEFLIKGLHDVLGAGSYGYAIILFTLFIKAVTFPLTYQQIESSTKMQALQPKVKALQEKYGKTDPTTMNQKLGELYTGANVNPLSALLPTFVQLPVLLSLYKGLNHLAEDDALEEAFLWLPNLEGPTFGNRGMDWLFNFADWKDGVPPLGWNDTLAFLSFPAILVVTQKVSLELQKPPDAMENPQTAQTYKVLGYLPFFLGLTSLSVPSGLSLYWIINNVLTTGTTLAIKAKVKEEMEGTDLGSPAKSSPAPAEPDFSRGFGQTAKVVPKTTRTESGTVTIRPPGAPADAEVLDATVVDATTTAVLDPVAEVGAEAQVVSANQLKKRKKVANKVKKKKKGR